MSLRVLSTIVEIKNKIIEKNGFANYEIIDGKTCVENWIKLLNDKTYNDMFEYVQFAQINNLVLVRYARYSDVFGGEIPIEFNDFWEMYDGFYKECRSSVYDVENECIVIYNFDKFFNLGETKETEYSVIEEKIKNAKSVEISDKLDGSIMAARYYNDEIIMSSSKSIDRQTSWRLADAYQMINSNNDYKNAIINNPNYTLIFEYISLADSHVVKYDKNDEGLYLIGIRNIDGVQMSYNYVLDFAKNNGLKSTKLFNKTLSEIINELDDKKSDEAEGFVINIDGLMVKIKYNDYVNIHKVLSKISSINLIIKSIADDWYDDLLSKVPNVYKNRIENVANIIFKYIKETKVETLRLYDMVKDMEFKESMIYVNNNFKSKYKGLVINLLRGRENNYIKQANGRYLKLKEMGVNESKYMDIFSDEDFL